MDDSEGAEGGSRAITSNGDSGEAEVGREKGAAAATNGESGVSGMEMEIDLEPENTAVEPEPDTAPQPSTQPDPPLPPADVQEVEQEEEEEGGGDKLSSQEIKYWSAVKENPSDFSSWTQLLQLVEQKGKLGPAREVFDAFLRTYPYCYGYWKKYADFEKKHSDSETAKEVFERGLKVVPLSVELWVHYLNFATAAHQEQPGAEGLEEIRSLYKRAVEGCGLEYRSSKLWNSYLEWEKSPQHLLAVYDNLLTIPTQQFEQYFEKFKQLVEATPPSEFLSKEEYEELSSATQSEATGGESEQTQEEGAVDKLVRQKVLEKRTAVFEACRAEVEKRQRFEEGIKRPYFHVKPLERGQLRNWREYLDFEVSQGDQRRIITLFERCMIACALYEDFWTKFAKYAEEYCPEYAESVFTRACTVHLQQKPAIHVSWAAYEEKRGNTTKARDILANIDSLVPGLVFVRLRRIGVEVRAQSLDRAEALYQDSVASAQGTETRNFYSWRYARFAAKLLGDHNKAAQVLQEALEQDQGNPTLYLQLLEVETSRQPPSEEAAEGVFGLVQNSELPEESKQAFALRRLQFLEEFGSSLEKLLTAQEECQRLKKLTASARKRSAAESEGESAKKAKVEGEGGTPSSTQQLDAQTQEQQWAAYQQQWGTYPYTQQGYNYQQYYQQYPAYGQAQQ